MPCTDCNCYGCNQIPVLTIHYNLVEKINSFGQQLSEAALASCLVKILGSIALKNRIFRWHSHNQLRGAASKSKSRATFREPRRRITLGSRFGKQVCKIARLGKQLWRIFLRQQHWRTASGTSLWSIAGNSFGEQLSGAAFHSNFEEPQLQGQLWEQLSGVAVRYTCGDFFWGTAALGQPLCIALKNSFRTLGEISRHWSSIDGQSLQKTAFDCGSSFRKQLLEAAFGNNFPGQA